MRTGILADTRNATDPFAFTKATVQDADDLCLSSLWFQMPLAYDASVLAAYAGTCSDRLEIGIGVLPIQTRHPLAMAQFAVTARLACRGGFTLGLGVSHKPVVEQTFGLNFHDPVGDMKRYLDVLLPNINGNGPVSVRASEPPEVVLGALGPRMLHLAAERTGGTVTWLTGPKGIAGQVVPILGPSARVIAILPVWVTDDPGAAREAINRRLAGTSKLPSYRRMLRLEGVTEPADVALFGDPATVQGRLAELAAAGATDLIAIELAADESERLATRQMLAEANGQKQV